MFRNLKKKRKKNSFGKKSQMKILCSCSNFVYALYILISSNLQIILKKTIYSSRLQRVEPILKTSKNLVVNLF